MAQMFGRITVTRPA